MDPFLPAGLSRSDLQHMGDIPGDFYNCETIEKTGEHGWICPDCDHKMLPNFEVEKIKGHFSLSADHHISLGCESYFPICECCKANWEDIYS